MRWESGIRLVIDNGQKKLDKETEDLKREYIGLVYGDQPEPKEVLIESIKCFGGLTLLMLIPLVGFCLVIAILFPS